MSEPFLSGVRVLDLSRLLPGPYATTQLADMGADVVKVEEPTVGDPVRERRPRADDRSYTVLARNRNKESIAIDLKSEEGHEAFLNLAAEADVVFESFRPGVVDRLGVGYEDVRAVNEEIIYCSLTGYGQDGPCADRPGHDLNYVGISGLLGLTGDPDGPPAMPGYPVADFAGGLYAAMAIVAALAGRSFGRGGEYIDVSMTDVVASFSTAYADRYTGEGFVPRRGGTYLTGGHPAYQVFETADGEYVTVAALEEPFWNSFCDVIGEPELKDDYVGANETLPAERHQEVVERFQARLRERTREEWMEEFVANDVPAGPVNDFEEVIDDPQLRTRGIFQELALDDEQSMLQIGAPVQFGGDRLEEPEPVSRLGADTAALLHEIGYDEERIRELAESGAVNLGE